MKSRKNDGKQNEKEKKSLFFLDEMKQSNKKCDEFEMTI